MFEVTEAPQGCRRREGATHLAGFELGEEIGGQRMTKLGVEGPGAA